MSKEVPFMLLDEPLRNGSTVQIRPGYNGHQRLHVGRRGFICKVTPLHDYCTTMQSTRPAFSIPYALVEKSGRIATARWRQ